MSCIVSSSSVQSGMPCPAGAVQFLFKLPDGRKYIHCGDMRFGKHLMNNEHLQRFIGADGVYLDTTYCKTKHQFPPQVPCFLKHNLGPAMSQCALRLTPIWSVACPE